MTTPTATAANALAEAERTIAEEMPGVYALIVMRGGRPVLERYFHDTDAAQPYQTHSVTKSVVSMLVGIALAEGKLRSVDDPISRYLDVPRGADPRVAKITLAQLLTMTAGWRDGPVRARNVVAAILRRPLVREPGTKWEYDSGSSHVVSAILSRATGMSAAEYAAAKLFGPLNIQPLEWPADPQGFTSGGAGLVVRARELALLGELYRRGGEWESGQLVPRAWVDESTQSYVDTDDPAFGYGYYWWIRKDTKTYWARGYGGQMIIVAPAKDAVIVAASDPEQRPDTPRLAQLVLRALG